MGFPCEKCGIELNSRKDLIYHLETHIGRKSRTKYASEVPKCDHCQSEFTIKKSLDRHKLLMHDEHGRPKYRCEECDINSWRSTTSRNTPTIVANHVNSGSPLKGLWSTTKRSKRYLIARSVKSSFATRKLSLVTSIITGFKYDLL